MTLRWIEGFETSNADAHLSRTYTRSGSQIGTLTGREQGVALEGSGAADLELTTPVLVSPVANTWIIGFGVRFSNAITMLATGLTAWPGLEVFSGATSQVSVDFVPFNTDAGSAVKIQVRRGVTVLGTTTKVLEGQNWYYVEVKVVVRTGVNGSCEVKVGLQNNPTTAWLTLAGINTANATTDGADNFKFRWSNSGATNNLAFDDIYINDSAGSVNNDYLGPVTVTGFLPNATGATMNWILAGTATDIADALGSPANAQSTSEDNKRITSEVIGQIALAGYPNTVYAQTSTLIHGIMVDTQALMDTTGSRTIKHRLRSTTGGGAETDGTASLTISSTSIATVYEVFETNPNAAGAVWTKAEIDAIQIGVKLSA